MSAAAIRPRRGMTLIEVMFAVIILTGVLLGLGAFSGKFAQANSQAHLVITANEIAASRLDELRTQSSYTALDLLATGAKPDTIRTDNTAFARITKVTRYGGIATKDSVDYKVMTVTVTNQMMTKTVQKSSAIAAW